MSQPTSDLGNGGFTVNGDLGGHLSLFTDSLTTALNLESRLLSTFKTDTHARKVYLAGRGESAIDIFLPLKNHLFTLVKIDVSLGV